MGPMDGTCRRWFRPGRVGVAAVVGVGLLVLAGSARAAPGPVVQGGVTLSQALAAVQVAAADSALALAGYRTAAEARREAVVEQGRQDAALAAAEAEVSRQRAEVARWVWAVYADGGTLGSSPTVHTLLAGGSTDDVVTRRAWLGRVSARQAGVAVRLRVAVDARREAWAAARRASAAAEAAAGRARAASRARDAVLAVQRERLGVLESAFAAARVDARVAGSRVARLAAEHLDAAHRAVDVLATGDGYGVVGPVGVCVGGDVSGYANGRIPVSALCPLPGSSGELLRADAAYAFERMDAAFAARFGHPVCVSDAYRSYDDQVRVRAERPGLAAAAGRSNHGWGTAVDLCGGVERFGSAEHLWMRSNASLFGWFHPTWARPGGALPEPWHWEFSG